MSEHRTQQENRRKDSERCGPCWRFADQNPDVSQC
ncbi:Uncharacterised protein [Vibrio cholerae]|nr:Uncharacterised protein [Vibrio cholerae]